MVATQAMLEDVLLSWSLCFFLFFSRGNLKERTLPLFSMYGTVAEREQALNL